MEDKKPIYKEILEWIYCIIIAVVLALLVRYYIGTPTIVQQESMYPTLIEGQRLILNRWVRTAHKTPERGDIITFEAPTIKTLQNVEQDPNSNPKAIYKETKTNIFSKFAYYVLEIKKESYIKRVIGLPGEHVQIKDGSVYINGEKLDEPYLQPNVVTELEQYAVLDDFIVPEGHIFAIGDNREYSTDCRAFGCIPLEKVESKVAIRFWPLNLFGKIK